MKSPSQMPPQFFLRFFRWYCHPKLVDHIEGDLLEDYGVRIKKSGKRKADIQFIIDVLLLCRPGIIRPTEGYKNLNNYGMYKSYVKVGWRTLLRNKGYSAINIGGLAAGMAIAILIGLWVYDELTYDQYHKNYEQIGQIRQHQFFNGKIQTGQAIPFPLGEELKTSYGDNFKYIVMSSWKWQHILSQNDKVISQTGAYMDKDAARLLSLEMVVGSHNGLQNKNSILLSASTAKALFGNVDALNQLMRIDNKLDVTVTGIYQDLPNNTTFSDLSFIAPWELYITSEPWLKRAATQWDNNSFQIFAQIGDHSNFITVNHNIKDSKLNKVAEEDKKYNAQIFLHPMRDWHLRSGWQNGIQTGGLIEYVWLFSTIGIFVLLLACINFMNLSTARSEKRAKEVGVRKTIGSLKSQLVNQFLSESILITLLAFVVSLVVVQFILPWFNLIAGKQLAILWADYRFWVIGLGFMFLTGIIAGSYPALYLSSFNTIRVLKGRFKVGRLASLPRKILVVVQFTVSVALVIATLMVNQQVQFTKNRPIGYDRNGLVSIEMLSPDFYGKFEVLKTELTETGAITNIALSSSPLTAIYANGGGFSWEGKDPDLYPDFGTIWVSHDFGSTVGWHFKEGRDFSIDYASDSSAVILNEAAVKFMGITNPVGKTLRWGSPPNENSFTIIGVIQDMVTQSPYAPVKQTVYLFNNNNENFINLRLNPEKSTTESIATIEQVLKKIIPSAPFNYKFADEAYAAKFLNEERIEKLATCFTVLAIFISFLGLFGLASFVAEQRTKEISIRKIVGASIFNLWQLLSKDFFVLVSLSCLIAMPLAFYFIQGWLEHYQYRTDISWTVFAVSGFGAVGLTLLTVSYQTIKAALSNPVKSLRSE